MKAACFGLVAIAVIAGVLPASAGYRAASGIQFHFQPTGAIAPKVDLRPEIRRLQLHIRDQGDRGTCSVFATTFLVEFRTAGTTAPTASGAPGSRSLVGLDLSEDFLNWAKNVASNTNKDGGFFNEIIAGYERFGMVTQSDMPNKPAYHPNHPDTPSGSAIEAGRKFPRFQLRFIKQWDNQHGMSDQEIERAKAELSAGRPVATGIWWLTNFETVTVDRVPLLKEYPRSDSNHTDPSQNPMFDGHSIDLVGYHEGNQFPGGGYFIFRNSFGRGFGDDGYGFVSFKYMRDYANDMIVVDPAAPTYPIDKVIAPPSGAGSVPRPHS